MTPHERRLSLACRHISEASEGLADWAGASERLIPSERVALQDEFCRASASARALTAAVQQMPALGVVGPARSGKTLLIASLIAGGPGPVLLGFEGFPQRLNLVEHLVPVGGNFASGTITRYSSPKRPVRRGFPIEVRLLSLAEVVMILGQAYFTSCAAGARTIATTAQVRIAHIEAERHVQPAAVRGLTESEVLAMRDYFCTRFGHLPAVEALTSAGYWDSLAEIAPYVPDAVRGTLLRRLWGGLAPFDAAYEQFNTVLAALGHNREASCNLDALADCDPQSGQVVLRSDSIMGTGPLQALNAGGTQGTQTIVVFSAHAHVTQLSRAALTGLVAEIRLPIDPAPGGLLQQTDILEYPAIGVAGTAVEFGSQRDARSETDAAIFTRLFCNAKARFLHERDIAANEMTSMLVCLDQGQPSAGALASLVGEWVAKSHGADAAARELQECGLFIALTKLDAAFIDATPDARERRIDWESRVGAPLDDDFSRFGGWPAQWTPGRPFDNVTVINSPAFRAPALFDPGSERQGTLYGTGHVKADLSERVQRAREAFLESPAVRRHVADPAGVWDDAFHYGDGGIARLTRSIADVCQAGVKYRQLFADADQLRATVKNSVIRYVPGDLPSIPFDHRRSMALIVARRLRSAAEAHRLNTLFAAMSVADAELVEVFRDLEARLEPRDGQASPSPLLANFDVLLARAALDSWVSRVRSFARGGQIEAAYHVPSATLLSLIDELVIGANRTGVETRIAARIASACAGVRDPAVRIEIAAICASRLINNFLFHLGYENPRGNTQLRRKDKAETPIFTRAEAPDLSRAVDDTSNPELNIHADWAQAFLALVEDNVRDLGENTTTAEEAGLLGGYLKKLDMAQ